MGFIAVIIGTFSFFLLLYMWIEGRKNKITYTELSFTSFPEHFSGMKFFFISDIHHREISKSIIGKLEGQVDMIIIGGDLAEKGVPFAKIKKNIQSLVKIAPTYFVWGNNDYEVDHLQLKKLLHQEGVISLINQSKAIKKGTDTILLIGVDDLGHRFDDLEKALATCEKGFRILVSHNPNIRKKIGTHHQIKLILSGHTHGGQIRLFGFGLTEKAGIFRLKEEMFLLVSNGYGTTRLPLRLGAPAEAHIITLTKKTI